MSHEFYFYADHQTQIAAEPVTEDLRAEVGGPEDPSVNAGASDAGECGPKGVRPTNLFTQRLE